uniref:Predicted protein n=1 Tax=Hordeum vulgare subsp. vulgare TaxID=112509 RepID=F2DRD5_HORVV|nr:predicted protein [Hordeum vulgare subsp. vulgare]
MLELVALVVSVVGWFATPIITKSIAAATEYARETEKQFNEVSTKLDKLAKDLKLIQTTVHKARLYFINKGEGEEILWELKGAIDEADEILDLFEYERLKNKPDGICYKFARDFTRRLDKVLENLDIARGSAQAFLENPTNIIDDSDIFRSARETGPSTRNDFFFGYAQQHGRLKRLLIVEQNKVIAIIGHGGMGKTRQVYHDNKLKFDVRIWAHIGNKSGELDLLTQICKSAIKSSGSLWLTIPDDPSIAVLHSKLQVLVNPKGGPQKSCLVVLDDVWQNEGGSGIIRSLRDEAWMSVLDMFKGLKNCKVVMTTRDKVCSNTVNAKPTIFLDGISEEEIMSKLLLKYIANLPNNLPRWDQRRRDNE